MAYTLINKCAKNLCKRTVLLQLIIKNVVTCFFGTPITHKNVIFHPFAQKPPVGEFVQNLVYGVLWRT